MTAWNIEGRLQGTLDLPLAELGVKQALKNIPVIRELGVHRIVCSTARRARQTARLYASWIGLPVHKTPELREFDHGTWEGKNIQELLRDSASGYATWLSDPGSIEIPGGSETVLAAQQRVVDAVLDAATSFRGQTILIVGHKHINALLMCALLGEPLTSFRTQIVENTLPHLLPSDTVQRLAGFGGGAANRRRNVS
jgi:broad specificity phosphatase PhoE